jgi:putative ABC transport system permease protein
VPVDVTFTDDEDQETESGVGLVVDPSAYARAHPGSDAVDALRGRVVVRGPGGDLGAVGETRPVRAGDSDLGPLPVVAAVPAGIDGPGLLLPPGLVPAAELADAPSRTFVGLAPGADAAQVARALPGVVTTLDAWVARDAADRRSANDGVFLVVMGLGGLYALIGVINAVVIAAADRRQEFAVARASGLTRRQVVRMALWEAWAVTTIGLLLGGLAAAGTFLAVATTTAAVTGVATLAVPWAAVLAVGAGAFAVTGATSVLTSWSATSRRAGAVALTTL